VEGSAKALVDGYEKEGVDVVKFLRGSFALALLRERGSEALLAVDCMGIRPMTYTLVNGCLVFGSNLDSVRAFPLVVSTVSPQAIFEYLYFSVIPSPRTIYTEHRKIEPAQYLHYHAGQVKTGYYWHPSFRDSNRESFDELRQHLRTILWKAVKRCDVACDAGTFLSGGIDSSTICGIRSEICPAPTETYSIGFDVQGYDETEYARITSRHFKTNSHEYYVTAKDAVDAAPIIAENCDEPFGNSSAVPVYYCARLAKENGIETMLAGDGGDELFAGNTRYIKQKMFELYSIIPRQVRNVILQPLIFRFSFGDYLSVVQKARSYIRRATIPLPERLQTYNLLETVSLEQIFESDFLNAIDPQQSSNMLREIYTRSGATSSLNRMLYLDWKLALADNDLRKVNRMCEVLGMEVRYPMLDSELVEFSARVPAPLKLKAFQLRYFFKQALKDFLPPEVLAKRKHGFGLPFGRWLRTSAQLHQLVHDSLARLKDRRYLRAEFLDWIVEKHKSDHADFYGAFIWVLMMLELWLEARER
jgi:asparagine synthase (glutamine-hydrolysing)